MQIIFKTLILASVASLLAFTPGPTKQVKTVTTTFWVAGICGLCEELIEKAMDTRGVVAADYVLDTNMLTVTYKPKKISEDQLHQLLNDAGYDTDKSKATDDQYSRTPGCCKYREQEKH
ncbi:MAG: heavy-metal-associated domain-containing protein [Flavobacteriales bacterium]